MQVDNGNSAILLIIMDYNIVSASCRRRSGILPEAQNDKAYEFAMIGSTSM